MALDIINGPTIAAGESLSGPIDVQTGELVRVVMPPAWTAAPLSFQGSSDGVSYQDVYDYHGGPIAVNVMPGSAMIFPSEWARAVAFLKFRSGMPDNPVPQEAARTFAVAVNVPGGGPAARTGKRR